MITMSGHMQSQVILVVLGEAALGGAAGPRCRIVSLNANRHAIRFWEDTLDLLDLFEEGVLLVQKRVNLLVDERIALLEKRTVGLLLEAILWGDLAPNDSDLVKILWHAFFSCCAYICH